MLFGWQPDAEKRDGDADGEGDGDVGGAPAIPIRLAVDALDARDSADAPRRDGYDERGEPINYSDEVTVRRAENARRQKQLREECDEDAPEAEEERRRERDAVRKAEGQKRIEQQVLGNQRIVISNARAARARRAATAEEMEARRLAVIAKYDGDLGEPAAGSEKGKGPELG